MSITPSLASQFKFEDQRRGEDLFNDDAVILSSSTDVTVRALIKASGAPRVSLGAEAIGDRTARASCTCPGFAKGANCKHIWATLLALEARDADFLSGKADLARIERVTDPAIAARREALAAEKRTRARELRREKKRGSAKPSPRPTYPEPVDEALTFFNQNGFDLAADLSLEHVLNAKRTLARVFHPDKGGSHEEAIALNENFEILRDYLNS